MTPWTYKEETLTSIPEGMEAFVYIITLMHQGNPKFYIGKKNFYSTRRKKVVGKTRRVITISESPWQKYIGSSDTLKALLKEGAKIVGREILVLCKTPGSASYHEARLQFEHSVLCSEDYLNKWISVKVARCY